MVKDPDWVSFRVDKIAPHAARVYDYWLDGAHNFASDREMANEVQLTMPGIRDAVRIQRSFLRRAVLFMVDSGIRQFLDIGSGIPTLGNVHEIAQRTRSRVPDRVRRPGIGRGRTQRTAACGQRAGRGNPGGPP
jgi:hypothetical protein